jgi:hypothetical protein
MRLQLTSYKTTYTVETEHDDLDINEYLDIMKGLLIQATFTESTVNQGIIDLANELKENGVWNKLKNN